MKRIAVVGNIASGKSEVEKILKNRGYLVMDTDAVAHTLLEDNMAVMNAFKNYDIFENNRISREKLGKLVFSDAKLKVVLENILHPQIKDKIKDFFVTNKEQELVFVSIPLLFEAKMEDLFDKVIFVYADDNVRLKRLIARNGYLKDYALARMNSQQSQEEKIKKSDFVIYNNSSLKNLNTEITNLIQKL